MLEELYEDFKKARKGFLKALAVKDKRICIALHNTMVKIHKKLLILEQEKKGNHVY